MSKVTMCGVKQSGTKRINRIFVRIEVESFKDTYSTEVTCSDGIKENDLLLLHAADLLLSEN